MWSRLLSELSLSLPMLTKRRDFQLLLDATVIILRANSKQNSLMKKYILPALLAIFAMITPSTILSASNLEVSNSADFSAQTLQFSGGQTVFARIQSSNVGGKKSQLNLRDNQYNLINSFKLERNGSYYSAVLAAPYNNGYYSLEAQIESESSSATSVKTIKVGSVANANVKVNVNSNTSGNEVLGESETQMSEDLKNPSPALE